MCDVELREGASFSLRPRAFQDVSRAFCGEGSALWQHAHVLALVTVCLNLCTCSSCFWTYVLVVLMFVNLFSWFEFTKEWLIQNCLWQKYTLLWLYSSGSNIVMGLLRGRKPIWVFKWSWFRILQVALAPIRVADTFPSPLLAVLKVNSQAITQYCKVHGASREAVPRPAQHSIACLHTCTRCLPVGMAAEGSPCRQGNSGQLCLATWGCARRASLATQAGLFPLSSLCNSLERLLVDSKPVPVQL